MNIQPSLVESRLSAFIFENLLEEELSDGIDPLTVDAVDSLGLEQLVDYIGEEFGVTIDDEEMIRSNFASIPTLAAFVESKDEVR